MLTNIGNAILNNYPLQMVLDVLYLVLPIILLVSVTKNYRGQYALALLHVSFNFVYTLLLTIVAPLSIQWFAGWVLIPLIFMFKNVRSFYFALHCMRYIFILIFFSAGLWKIRGGGVFNIEQMSAIFVRQHSGLLLDVAGNWYEEMIRFFIRRLPLSYSIYIAGTIAELLFVIGFFTRKYDRFLIGVVVSFMILDFLLMKINYFSWLAFLGCLWFSNRPQPMPVGTALASKKYPTAT